MQLLALHSVSKAYGALKVTDDISLSVDEGEALGILGKEHLHARLEAAGCEMASYQYKQVRSTHAGLPWVIEAAFAWCPDLTSRRLITGVNWSPGILNPFRALGRYGDSLDAILSDRYADRDEPVVLVLHMACPRVEYTDRGKSAITMED